MRKNCFGLIICLSLLVGCASIINGIRFPDRQPAPAGVQTMADKLTRAAGIESIPVYVWGENGQDTIPHPVAYSPGENRIYVHVIFIRGDSIPSSLALWIGHEVGHAVSKEYKGWQAELFADRLGVILAAKAGYDAMQDAKIVCGLYLLYEKMLGANADYPLAQERCGAMVETLRQIGRLPAARIRSER